MLEVKNGKAVILPLLNFLSAILSLMGCGLSIATITYLSLTDEFDDNFAYLFCGAVTISVVVLAALLKILLKKIFYNISAIFLVITGILLILYDKQYDLLNVNLMCAASFFTGLIFGISTLTFVTHCGEISAKHVRGYIASYIQWSIDFGLFLGISILFINQKVICINSLLNIIGSLQIILGLLSILAANCLVYESPIFLFEMGNEIKAIENIKRLKKLLNDAEIKIEIENIRFILANKSNSVIKMEDIKSIIKVLLCRFAYSLSTSFFMLAMLLATFRYDQQFIIIGMFFGRFVANIIPIFLIDSLGRKKILATSLIGSGTFQILTTCALIFGVLLYMPYIQYYIVAVGAVIYNIFMGLGSSSATYTYMSEVFDYSRKTYINALIIVIEYIVHIVLIKILSLEIISIIVFAIIVTPAIIQLLIGGLSIILMPETKGKTLIEAEHLMMKK